MTILPPSRRRMTLDGTRRELHRQKHLVAAIAVRDGLLFALITHAVLTVIFSPRRQP